MGFAHPVGIITGGAGGIGEATARALGARGFRLVIADLDSAAARTCARRLTDDGLEAEGLAVDVTRADSVHAMVQETLARFGRIDVLVNNAGVESPRPFLDISLEDYERVMRVNTTSIWICSQAVIPVMLRQGKGAIVNMSSVAGQRGGGLRRRSAAAP